MQQPIKTYKQVNRQDSSVSFGISRMEEIHKRRAGITDAPHRHDFFTVLLIEKAQGCHTIDFEKYPLGQHQLFFVSPGQVHQLVEEQASVGYSIVFSNEFLIANHIPFDFIDNLELFNPYGVSPPMQLSQKQFATLQTHTEHLLEVYGGNMFMKNTALGAILKVFLVYCNNFCQALSGANQANEGGNHLLKNFKQLVNQNYKQWHHITQYADALSITPDHLNRVVKATVGQSAKAFVQARLVTAAKRLLFFTNLSNKEVGYELGFGEPANFSAFFKNCTGMSPTEFKKGVR